MKTRLDPAPTNVDKLDMEKNHKITAVKKNATKITASAAKKAKKDENRNSQVVRILNTIKILERNPQGISAEDIHQSLEELGLKVALRTTYRDLDAIAAAHFPLEKKVNDDDGKHLWHFNAIATVGGKIQISYEEIVALVISKEQLAPLKGTSFYKDIQSFFDKVEKLLGPKVQSELQSLRSTYAMAPTPAWATGIPQEVLDVVHNACVESQTIIIEYRSINDAAAGRTSQRKVGPIGLYLVASNIYLIAKDLTDGVVKKFALSRIRSAQWTEEPFENDGRFAAEQQFKDDFGVLSTGEVTDVTIHIREPIASYVAERRWHASQRVIRKDDLSIDFSLKVRANQELSRWILSLGPAAEVLNPTSLREEVAQLSREIAGKYGNKKSAA